MKMLTDPGHAVLLVLAVAIVVGIYLIYLVTRRRRNAGHHLDHLDDDHQQHPPGHGRQHGAGHKPTDPERHHL